MHRTNIEWTDLAANPLQYRDKGGKVVWGCVKHSTGCAHCYAEALAQRYNRGGPFTAATMRDLTPFLDEKELRHILTAKVIDKKPVAGSRCFLGDMTDVFGEWVPDELLDRLFAVLALRDDVTFQVLTKRADRMAAYFGTGRPWERVSNRMREHNQYSSAATEVFRRDRWPLPNVHLGVSVENQAAVDERIPHLLRVPAAVRFLSCEPLLGEVDLGVVRGCRGCNHPGNILTCWNEHGRCSVCDGTRHEPSGIHWVIVGGESGNGFRMFNIEWARSLRDQCKAAGVAFFCKQLGALPYYQTPDMHGPQLLMLNDMKKGANTDEWPADLRVREFPAVVS